MSLIVLVVLIVVGVSAGMVVGSMASRRLGPKRTERPGSSAKPSARAGRDWATRAAVRAWKWRNKKKDQRK